MKVFNSSSSSSSRMKLSKMFLFCVCLSKLWIISTMMMNGGNLDFSFNNQGNNNAVLLFASAEPTVALVGADPLETWNYMQTGPLAPVFDGMVPIETENNNNNNNDEKKNLSSFEEKQKQFYSRFINLFKVLRDSLEIPEAKYLSEDQKLRIFQKYIPCYVYLINQMHNMKRRRYVKSYIKQDSSSSDKDNNINNKNGPMFVGFLAPPGTGKTTLSNSLASMCKSEGLNCVSVSIDDFYVRRSDQKALHLSHLDNPYLVDRGFPGTHDIPLIYETFQKLKNFKDGDDVRVPVFAKHLFDGDGDRLPYSEWTVVQKKPDLVLLEGWFLGFAPQPENSAIFKAVPSLKIINTWLEDFQKLWSMMDTWVVIKCADYGSVYNWRREAERRMKDRTGEGVSDDSILNFVAQTEEFYNIYSPELYAGTSSATKGSPVLVLTINKDRAVSHFEIKTSK